MSAPRPKTQRFQLLLSDCIKKAVEATRSRHDANFRYTLPFLPGNAFQVAQGYGGTFTHFGHSHYAIDFWMKQGTPICAARSGRVMRVVQHFTEGGLDASHWHQCNRVDIRHSDGSFACYCHLKVNGAAVREGQNVSAGEVIAYSGNTGYSGGPHLHFQVTHQETNSGVPTFFEDHRGEAMTLVEGHFYSRRSPSNWGAKLQSAYPGFYNMLVYSRYLWLDRLGRQR